MGVLLVLVIELPLELGDNVLHLKRCHELFRIEPKLLHQLSKADCQLALCTQWVRVIDFLLEVALEEVLGKTDSVGETLNGAAQVARVVQVTDPGQAHPRVLIRLA